MRPFAAITAIMLLIPPAVSAETGSQQYFIQQKAPSQVAAEELQQLRQNVRDHENDANAHLALADALRKRQRNQEAAAEYVRANALNPELWVGYHQLTLVTSDAQLLDDAISKLTKLKMEKPKELMLRVALSELLEKRKQYYQAARVLIEMTYDNAVPPKWNQRVSARIHYLLSKSKDAQLATKDNVPSDEDLDVVPAPLPETGLRKGLTASKINESKDLKGTGRVPLIP